MKDIFPQINGWVAEGRKFAVATVVGTWGSSPRPVGSSLIIDETGAMAGSVSGGCVEGAVVKKALEMLQDAEVGGQPLHFGVSDEDAWAVGLSCGGKLDVYLEPFDYDKGVADRLIYETLAAAQAQNAGCIYATELKAGKAQHILIKADGIAIGQQEDEAVVETALQLYQERKSALVNVAGQDWFFEIFPPRPRMLIVGAAHITVDLVRFANIFGMETIVIDPRRVFASKTQFDDAPHQLWDEWPAEVLPRFQLDPYTYAVILSHDPKIDDQALHVLLRSDVAYIGALGSKRTHAKRVARLQEAGYTESEIARIQAPVGVDINAKTPREIALSVMAAVIQAQNRYL